METNLTISSQLIVCISLLVFWGSVAVYVLKGEKRSKAH